MRKYKQILKQVQVDNEARGFQIQASLPFAPKVAFNHSLINDGL